MRYQTSGGDISTAIFGPLIPELPTIREGARSLVTSAFQVVILSTQLELMRGFALGQGSVRSRGFLLYRVGTE